MLNFRAADSNKSATPCALLTPAMLYVPGPAAPTSVSIGQPCETRTSSLNIRRLQWWRHFWLQKPSASPAGQMGNSKQGNVALVRLWFLNLQSRDSRRRAPSEKGLPGLSYLLALSSTAHPPYNGTLWIGPKIHPNVPHHFLLYPKQWELPLISTKLATVASGRLRTRSRPAAEGLASFAPKAFRTISSVLLCCRLVGMWCSSCLLKHSPFRGLAGLGRRL